MTADWAHRAGGGGGGTGLHPCPISEWARVWEGAYASEKLRAWTAPLLRESLGAAGVPDYTWGGGGPRTRSGLLTQEGCVIRSGPLAWRFWVGVFSQQRWVVGTSVGRGWSRLRLQGVRPWVCGCGLGQCVGEVSCSVNNNDSSSVDYCRLSPHLTCLSSLDHLEMSFFIVLSL